jgi:hypothetical protein
VVAEEVEQAGRRPPVVPGHLIMTPPIWALISPKKLKPPIESARELDALVEEITVPLSASSRPGCRRY